MPEQGESLMRKDLGRFDLHKFVMRNADGKKIEPWKKQGAYAWEWLRNDSALLGLTREEEATFSHIEKDSRIYINDNLLQNRTADLAIFYSNVDGNKFDLVSRLVPKTVKEGDKVKLIIMGCCSIVDVKKK